MNSQMLPRAKTEGYWNNMEQLYVLFLCQVTQKLKGMEDSISDLNTTVIKSAGGAKHRVFATEVGSNEMELPGHSPRGWRFLMIFA